MYHGLHQRGALSAILHNDLIVSAWLESCHSIDLAPRSRSEQKSVMIVDLIKLLASRSIVHPNRITAIETAHRALRITVTGFPWWTDRPTGSVGQIIFEFEGLGEGLLDTDSLLNFDEDETLEVFEVTPVFKQPWAGVGTWFSTYCSTPLPHPFDLYAELEDFLVHADAPRSARDYLNVPDGSIRKFCEVTQANTYLLSNCPRAIHEIVLRELERKGVKFSVIETERASTGELFVRIGRSAFFCQRATATAL
jgi:hypothetical protein